MALFETTAILVPRAIVWATGWIFLSRFLKHLTFGRMACDLVTALWAAAQGWSECSQSGMWAVRTTAPHQVLPCISLGCPHAILYALILSARRLIQGVSSSTRAKESDSHNQTWCASEKKDWYPTITAREEIMNSPVYLSLEGKVFLPISRHHLKRFLLLPLLQ